MSLELRYAADLPEGTTRVLIPGGLATPHGTVDRVEVDDATTTDVIEATTGQRVVIAAPAGPTLTVIWHAQSDRVADYPEAMFVPSASRYTRVELDFLKNI